MVRLRGPCLNPWGYPCDGIVLTLDPGSSRNTPCCLVLLKPEYASPLCVTWPYRLLPKQIKVTEIYKNKSLMNINEIERRVEVETRRLGYLDLSKYCFRVIYYLHHWHQCRHIHRHLSSLLFPTNISRIKALSILSPLTPPPPPQTRPFVAHLTNKVRAFATTGLYRGWGIVDSLYSVLSYKNSAKIL